MTDNAEHEMREWLLSRVSIHTPDGRMAEAILARLDRPVLPRPEDVPNEVLAAMTSEFCTKIVGPDPHNAMRAALQVHYNHYAQPPAPEPVEMWVLAMPNGKIVASGSREYVTKWRNDYHGSRIVRLVEDRDDR